MFLLAWTVNQTMSEDLRKKDWRIRCNSEWGIKKWWWNFWALKSFDHSCQTLQWQSDHQPFHLFPKTKCFDVLRGRIWAFRIQKVSRPEIRPEYFIFASVYFLSIIVVFVPFPSITQSIILSIPANSSFPKKGFLGLGVRDVCAIFRNNF